jgi:hypothetical protein
MAGSYSYMDLISMDFRKFYRILERCNQIQERRNEQLEKQKRKGGK